MSNALAMGQAQVAVAKQQLEAIEQQGRDTLTLIHAAAPAQVAAAAPANTAPGVGAQVNVVA